MGINRYGLPYSPLRRVFFLTLALPEIGYPSIIQGQRVETREGRSGAPSDRLEVYCVGIRSIAGGRTIGQDRSKSTVGEDGGCEIRLQFFQAGPEERDRKSVV